MPHSFALMQLLVSDTAKCSGAVGSSLGLRSARSEEGGDFCTDLAEENDSEV